MSGRPRRRGRAARAEVVADLFIMISKLRAYVYKWRRFNGYAPLLYGRSTLKSHHTTFKKRPIGLVSLPNVRKVSLLAQEVHIWCAHSYYVSARYRFFLILYVIPRREMRSPNAVIQ